MRRKRATARFYVILLVLLSAIGFFVARPWLFPRSNETVIMMANASQIQTVDCVIIRDEALATSESTARVEYSVPENTLVEVKTPVASIYTTGYSESLLGNLETTRQNIQNYHKQLLANIVDNDLSRLDAVVNAMALEFKNLINRKTTGNLQSVVAQLETAMVNRQDYLRQNKREDNKLTKLYEAENTALTNIQSWRKVSNADRTGVVSFYIDGYEADLNARTVGAVTIPDLRAVLNGGSLTNTKTTRSNGIYRIVNQDRWFIAALVEGDSWTPVKGQDNYVVQLEGFDDLSFAASVYSVKKENNVTLAIFEINNPVGPLIYQRTGKARFSVSLTGLSVRVEALYDDKGQMGVWLYDTPEGTFVPVEVLSSDGRIAMIKPLTEGALQLGQTVLIKR